MLSRASLYNVLCDARVLAHAYCLGGGCKPPKPRLLGWCSKLDNASGSRPLALGLSRFDSCHQH